MPWIPPSKFHLINPSFTSFFLYRIALKIISSWMHTIYFHIESRENRKWSRKAFPSDCSAVYCITLQQKKATNVRFTHRSIFLGETITLSIEFEIETNKRVSSQYSIMMPPMKEYSNSHFQLKSHTTRRECTFSILRRTHGLGHASHLFIIMFYIVHSGNY